MYLLLKRDAFSPRHKFRERSSILFCRPLAGRELGPASSRKPDRKNLALAVLEAAPCALLSVLLAFLHARIARQETVLAQAGPQVGVQLRKRARKSHAHRSRLSAHAAALYGGLHFHLFLHLREFQRLDSSRVPRHVSEIFIHRAAVYREARR